METKFFVKDTDIMTRLVSYVNSAKWPVVVSIKPAKTKRSLLQNNLYWAWLTDLSPYTGYNVEELHTLFKVRFLGLKAVKFDGIEYQVPKSTTELTTKQFTEYLDKIYAAASQIGVTLHWPDYYGFER